MDASHDNTNRDAPDAAPDAAPTREQVADWQQEARAFFTQLRRELSCLTGADPTLPKDNAKSTRRTESERTADREALNERLDASLQMMDEALHGTTADQDAGNQKPLADRNHQDRPDGVPRPSEPTTNPGSERVSEQASDDQPSQDGDRLSRLKQSIASRLADEPSKDCSTDATHRTGGDS